MNCLVTSTLKEVDLMKDKFEYRLVEQPKSKTIAEIEKILDEWGSMGWELSGIDYGCFIFKRQRA